LHGINSSGSLFKNGDKHAELLRLLCSG
jgi:hypothetical protein